MLTLSARLTRYTGRTDLTPAQRRRAAHKAKIPASEVDAIWVGCQLARAGLPLAAAQAAAEAFARIVPGLYDGLYEWQRRVLAMMDSLRPAAQIAVYTARRNGRTVIADALAEMARRTGQQTWTYAHEGIASAPATFRYQEWAAPASGRAPDYEYDDDTEAAPVIYDEAAGMLPTPEPDYARDVWADPLRVTDGLDGDAWWASWDDAMYSSGGGPGRAHP